MTSVLFFFNFLTYEGNLVVFLGSRGRGGGGEEGRRGRPCGKHSSVYKFFEQLLYGKNVYFRSFEGKVAAKKYSLLVSKIYPIY